ncbi:hypothetical protein Tco_1043532 [Tanacetum coccineum]|uniref:Uncharacterized protein n=1 Tax=Tanacetum coccineum TaxID=301880 RepID=A0ABQ5GPI2_9ASTR
MSTPIDFSAFAMNRLKLNKITKADLVGSVFNLLKGTYKICVKLEYNMEECYRALTDQLDWTNPEGHKHSVDMSKPLPLQDNKVKIAYDKDAALRISHEGPQRQKYYRAMINQIEKKSGYGYLEEIVVRRADQKLYKFKEGDFLDLYLNDIKDMLLMISQNKLFNLEGVKSYQRKLNLTKPQRTCPHISVKEPYTPNFDPPGVIYEDKSKKKRLMRVDEIHKFCDGTLQSVRNILRERLPNFKFGYNKGMSSREWTSKDKRCTSIMLNKIND